MWSCPERLEVYDFIHSLLVLQTRLCWWGSIFTTCITQQKWTMGSRSTSKAVSRPDTGDRLDLELDSLFWRIPGIRISCGGLQDHEINLCSCFAQETVPYSQSWLTTFRVGPKWPNIHIGTNYMRKGRGRGPWQAFCVAATEHDSVSDIVGHQNGTKSGAFAQ